MKELLQFVSNLASTSALKRTTSEQNSLSSLSILRPTRALITVPTRQPSIAAKLENRKLNSSLLIKT
jgi:hypothetical protein